MSGHKKQWSVMTTIILRAMAILWLLLMVGAASGAHETIAAAPTLANLLKSTAGLQWVSECADCSKIFSNMTDRSLRLDLAGHPHIAYGGAHLYYAWNDGVTWHLETVDSAIGVGAYASLALDGNGYAHISYYDDENDDLKYTYQDAAGWHIQTVASMGNVGEASSLALNADGFPLISYYDTTNGNLMYAVTAELSELFLPFIQRD